MEILKEPMPGLKLLKPRVFEDDRGYFYESYNKSTFEKVGIYDEFVQDNQSLSQKGVIRGLHFQAPPFAQAKLVRVIAGSVYDVAVDIRKGSPTYGRSYGCILSAANKRQYYIPVGFAHGFATLTDNTVFAYKCSNGYHKASEGSVLWNDPALEIEWPFDDAILSEKDTTGPLLKELESPFTYDI